MVPAGAMLPVDGATVMRLQRGIDKKATATGRESKRQKGRKCSQKSELLLETRHVK